MYREARVAVVVPAFNEAAHVGEVIETLPPIVDRAYVVDDASTDDTWTAITDAIDRSADARAATDGGTTPPDERRPQRAVPRPPEDASDDASTDPSAKSADDSPGGHHPAAGAIGPQRRVGLVADRADIPVVAVRHGTNRGRGAAVTLGYRLALADGADVVAVMDGDGQMDPTRLERVLDPVVTGRADYAKGNRLAGRQYWRGMSAWRLFGNLVLTGLTRVSSGYWGLRDPQNGYTAISRDALERVDLEELYADYGFLNDLLVKLNLADARVADVPLPAVYGDEESGIRYRTFVPALSALLLVNFLRRLAVEGTEKGRPWLPTAYGLAGVGWAGTAASAVALGLGAADVASPADALVTAVGGPSTGSLAVPLALGALALVATVLAVAIDRRQNAVITLPDGPVVTAG